MSGQILHWQEAAPARASGIPLVFLHGFLGTGADWASLHGLLDPPRRCLFPDLPGHGEAKAAAVQTMQAMAEALVADLDRQGVKRCVLAGYSMGGRIALYTAVHYPEHFTSLILESASPGLETDAERLERQRADAALAQRLEGMEHNPAAFASFLEEWYRQPMFAGLARNRLKRAAVVRHRMRNTPAGLATALRGLGLGAQPSLWEALPDLHLPVLLLAGEADAKFVGIAERMAARLPQAELRVLAGCGHNAHEEKPQTVAHLFNAFLDAQEG